MIKLLELIEETRCHRGQAGDRLRSLPVRASLGNWIFITTKLRVSQGKFFRPECGHWKFRLNRARQTTSSQCHCVVTWILDWLRVHKSMIHFGEKRKVGKVSGVKKSERKSRVRMRSGMKIEIFYSCSRYEREKKLKKKETESFRVQSET